jgi:GNAT superfamily N-acetyltransferase
MDVRVEPATAERWDDVAAIFGSRANACWCQRFLRHDLPDNRAALAAELEAAKTPVALIASVDGAAAGWTRVVPRSTLPGILGNRALQRLLDDDPHAWWVTCVNVRREFRGAGVGTELLRAATDWAREHGASVLDGHPVDVALLATRPSASAVFTGTVAMFRSAGFTEVGRTYPSRPVMRRSFTDGSSHKTSTSSA